MTSTPASLFTVVSLPQLHRVPRQLRYRCLVQSMRRLQNLRWKASNALPRVIPKKPELPVCPICSRPVILESAKVDEQGQAMHEECYLLKIHLQQDKSA
jgi:hypothetical protein